MEILQAVTATLRFPAAGADDIAFSGEVEVTITRDSDESTLVEAKEATKVEENDETFYTYELAGSDIQELDVLTCKWTDGESTYTTQVEVVGGFLVPLSAILKKLGAEAPESEVVAKREIALRQIEDACGIAFRPRYLKETLSGKGSERLSLHRRELKRVLAVEVEGAALSEAELAEIVPDPLGVLVRPGGWPAGRRNIVVSYVHGYLDYPDAMLPVRDYAAYLLQAQPRDINERATSMSTEEATYSLVTPGVRGARFPLPTVNALVERHSMPLGA